MERNSRDDFRRRNYWKLGINLVFEVAIKDDVSPSNFFGNEENSDIHLEVLANWNDSAPEGSQKGGFVPYLNVSAELKNQKLKLLNQLIYFLI